MRRFSTLDPGFDAAFALLVNEVRDGGTRVDAPVRAILQSVRDTGDLAVCVHTDRFDRHPQPLQPDRLRVTAAEIDDAVAQVPPALSEIDPGRLP